MAQLRVNGASAADQFLSGELKHFILDAVDAINVQNKNKANLIYNTLDSSEFWTPHAKKDSRSIMNITWKLPNSELESKFINEAKEAGLEGLKGHRSVGGIRASIYNACPTKSVKHLVEFMNDFADRNG